MWIYRHNASVTATRTIVYAENNWKPSLLYLSLLFPAFTLSLQWRRLIGSVGLIGSMKSINIFTEGSWIHQFDRFHGIHQLLGYFNKYYGIFFILHWNYLLLLFPTFTLFFSNGVISKGLMEPINIFSESSWIQKFLG